MVIWRSIFHFPHIFLEDISLPALAFFSPSPLARHSLPRHGVVLLVRDYLHASDRWGPPVEVMDMIGYDWIHKLRYCWILSMDPGNYPDSQSILFDTIDVRFFHTLKVLPQFVS